MSEKYQTILSRTKAAYDTFGNYSSDILNPYFPHCDAKILHAPGTCVYCDEFPYYQALREMWEINYTGQHETGKLPCPAEFKRPFETLDKWHGNKATKEVNGNRVVDLGGGNWKLENDCNSIHTPAPAVLSEVSEPSFGVHIKEVIKIFRDFFKK